MFDDRWVDRKFQLYRNRRILKLKQTAHEVVRSSIFYLSFVVCDGCRNERGESPPHLRFHCDPVAALILEPITIVSNAHCCYVYNNSSLTFKEFIFNIMSSYHYDVPTYLVELLSFELIITKFWYAWENCRILTGFEVKLL